MREKTPVFNIENEDDDLYATEIQEAKKYTKVDIDMVIEQQTHLNASQKQQLRSVMRGHETLFDRKLKKYTGKKMRSELLRTKPWAAECPRERWFFIEI